MHAPCLTMRFSNDASQVSIVTRDGKVSVFSIDNGETAMLMQSDCFLSKKRPFAQNFIPEFSPDGSKLFVQTEELRFRIMNTRTGKQIGPAMVTGSTHCVAVSADQAHCASGGDGYARVQSIRWSNGIPGFVRHDCRLTHDDAVTNLSFGGQLIATAGRDRVVQLWSFGDEKRPGGLLNEPATPLASLVHTSEIVGQLFDSAGRHLVTLQSDGLIRVWQIPSFEPPGYITHGTQGGSTIKPVGADRWLIAGSTHANSSVVNASLRRLKDGLVVAETPLNELSERGHLLDAEISVDQSKLISLHAKRLRSSLATPTEEHSGGSLQVWDFPDGRSIGSPIALSAEPRAVALHSAKGLAAVLQANAEIVLVDVNQPGVLGTLQVDENTPLRSAAEEAKPNRLRNGQILFTKDGEHLIAWGLGGGFSVWNCQKANPRFSTAFAKDWSVFQLAYSARAKQIAAVNDLTNRLFLMSDVDGVITREIEHMAKINSVEYSPGGDQILTACDDGRARIFDAINHKSRSLDLVHNKQVLDACFSPDGFSVATLTSEMRVYIWRLRDRQWAMKPMSVPKGTIELRFSQDSQFLLTMALVMRLKC